MINPQDLRVGNYVLFDTRPYYEKENWIDFCLDERNLGELLLRKFDSKYFKPISLSEEWLIKLGFEKKENFKSEKWYSYKEGK